MIYIIQEDDECTQCECGRTVSEGDEVEFIMGRWSWVCDTCPCCCEE